MKILLESLYLFIFSPAVILYIFVKFLVLNPDFREYWSRDLKRAVEKDGQIKGSFETLFSILFISLLLFVFVCIVLGFPLYVLAGNRSALAIFVSFGFTSLIFSFILKRLKKEWDPHMLSVIFTLTMLLFYVMLKHFLFPHISFGEEGVVPEILQQFL